VEKITITILLLFTLTELGAADEGDIPAYCRGVDTTSDGSVVELFIPQSSESELSLDQIDQFSKSVAGEGCMSKVGKELDKHSIWKDKDRAERAREILRLSRTSYSQLKKEGVSNYCEEKMREILPKLIFDKAQKVLESQIEYMRRAPCIEIDHRMSCDQKLVELQSMYTSDSRTSVKASQAPRFYKFFLGSMEKQTVDSLVDSLTSYIPRADRPAHQSEIRKFMEENPLDPQIAYDQFIKGKDGYNRYKVEQFKGPLYGYPENRPTIHNMSEWIYESSVSGKYLSGFIEESINLIMKDFKAKMLPMLDIGELNGIRKDQYPAKCSQLVQTQFPDTEMLEGVTEYYSEKEREMKSLNYVDLAHDPSILTPSLNEFVPVCIAAVETRQRGLDFDPQAINYTYCDRRPGEPLSTAHGFGMITRSSFCDDRKENRCNGAFYFTEESVNSHMEFDNTWPSEKRARARARRDGVWEAIYQDPSLQMEAMYNIINQKIKTAGNLRDGVLSYDHDSPDDYLRRFDRCMSCFKEEPDLNNPVVCMDRTL
jgi:hypothetical protein